MTTEEAIAAQILAALIAQTGGIGYDNYLKVSEAEYEYLVTTSVSLTKLLLKEINEG